MTSNSNVWIVAAAAVGVTVVGSVLRLVHLRRMPPETARDRCASLVSWWAVILATLAAGLLGVTAAAAMFCVVSLIAFGEFLALRVDHSRAGVTALAALAALAAYLLIPVSYLLIWFALPHAFLTFLPVAALVALAAGTLLWGQVQGYANVVANLYWGLLLVAYAPAFAVLLFTLPVESNPTAGGAGWFLFLLLLTEADDICQALIGRAIGRRRIAPIISPHKTWEGFIGGIVVTVGLAAVLGRWLTPWQPTVAMIAGLVISVGGFLGDLNISGIKRDCGVKDSGNLLPGQGGILDRIDSLTFAAPAFYGFVHFVDVMRL
jgi:phosphatidate cytidylyltransferase